MKKILWTVLLIVIIVGIMVGIKLIGPKSNAQTNKIANEFNKNTDSKLLVEDNKDKEYKRVELDDGILYTLNGEKEKSDIVVGDNYFDTTINDMFLNYDNYKDKKIEIEGIYFINDPYTFVGRYSESNLCPNCPAGYSYLEYQLDGNLDYEFTDEKEWIKVIGTLQKANDETSNYEDYFYLKVTNLEIMNKRGQETVKN